MSININILSNFNGAGFNKLERELSRLQTPMEKIGATAKALGPMATIGLGALTALGVGAVKAAEDAQIADNRLSNIAKSMGIFGTETDKVVSRLDAFATATMKATGIDDELIKSTQAKLLTFKNLASTADETGGAMDRATKAAIDLAAAGFGAAETNAVQLGKALQDPIKGITALSRAGVTFTAEEKEKIKALTESGKLLEAQDMILGALETQVGGTAEATATSSQKMTTAFGELSEQVGKALLPVFEAVVPIVMSLLTFMQENTGVVIALGAVFAALAVAIIAVNVAMYANPISLIIAGVALLIAGVILLINWLVKLAGGWDVVTKGFMDGLKAVGSFFKTTWDGIASFFTTVFGNIGKTFSTGFKAMETGLKNFGSFFETVWRAIAGVAKSILGNVLNTVEGFINFIIGGINNLINTINSVLAAGAVVGIDLQLNTIRPINIPALAEGGIVMPRPGGVLAQLAEAGKPEAVIPLDKLGSMQGGNTFNITVNAGMGANGTSIGRDIVDEILRFERSSGKVFARA